MKTLIDRDFLDVITKSNKLNLVIEDRVSFGFRTYGIDNHAEFIDYMNPHDNCLWDAIIPGYEHRLKPDSRYKSQKIIGMLLLSDGNHKIAVRVNKPGYDKSKAKKDIKTYVNNYLSSYLARKKHSRGEWVEIYGF